MLYVPDPEQEEKEVWFSLGSDCFGATLINYGWMSQVTSVLDKHIDTKHIKEKLYIYYALYVHSLATLSETPVHLHSFMQPIMWQQRNA